MTEPKIEVVTIGPDEARKLLHEDVNRDNRKIDYAVVDSYAREMAAGKWQFVGDPIRVSRTHRLLDGQQRLSAVVKCGKPHQFVLITGLDDETQTVMDTGKRRTPADFFAMNRISYAGTAAAVVQLVMRYDLRNVLDTKYKIQPVDLLDFYHAKGNRELVDCGTLVGEHTKRLVPLSPAITGALHVIVSRESEAFAVNDFFAKLQEGYGLEPGDPIGAMRKWLMRRRTENLRTRRHEWFYMMLRTWNAWATEEEAFRVQLPRDGLVSSDQIPVAIPVRKRAPLAVTEDNPAVTPYSKTRKEMEGRARSQRKKAS